MKYKLDIDKSKPKEAFESHSENFCLYQDRLFDLYELFNNKTKIVDLLDYWTLNIFCLKRLYGKKGILDFCNSKIDNPQRFSFLYELKNFKKVTEVRKNKTSTLFFYFLRPFVKKIYIPGAVLSSFIHKIFNRISYKYTESIPCKENKDLKNQLIILLRQLFEESFDLEELKAIESKIPFIFFSHPINNFNMKEVRVEGSCASLLEFIGVEKILLLQNIFISGYQHGGGYDIFEIDYFADYEKKLSDIFYGWGFSKYNKPQKRFKKIKKISKQIQNTERRILWIEDSSVPSFYFFTMPYHHFQSINKITKNYIFNELDGNSIQYSSLYHPGSKSGLYNNFRKDKYSLSGKGHSENIIEAEDILIFDNSGSTLIHFAIENNIIFYSVISRNDYERFTKLQKKHFEVLRKHHFGFFNDEIGGMSKSISSIIEDNDYAIPLELIDFNLKISISDEM